MIYVVEDDATVSKLEQYALGTCNYAVQIFESAEPFFSAVAQQLPELVILDIMLPGMDGIEILRKIRADPHTKALPVMMVTAKTSEIDVVTGLDGGADEYIPKPFGVMEFLSRVRAILRRAQKPASSGELSFQNISMDLTRRLVIVDGKVAELTYKEFELLKLFLSHPEEAVSRDEILSEVWETDVPLESRTIDMHVRTLRQKLGSAGERIQTIRKVGYVLTATVSDVGRQPYGKTH
ncbi:MAG: response regulator transcription factor [Oscillospiraceae bacterium]|nr:response regulator transcription factor [Oscillospiraceae bacterium]